MNWQTFIQSDFFWQTVIGVWVTQVVTTIVVAAKAPRSGWFWKAIRAIHGLLDKIDPPAPPAALVALMIATTALSLQGCSLEAARTKRLNSQLEASRTAQSPAKARPESECRFLDGVHVWGDWTAGGLAAVGAGAGVFASSTRNDDVKHAAIWTGVGAAALGAVAVGLASQSEATWSEQCQ